MHTKFERLLSKSLTTLEVMTYYLVVHTGPAATLTLKQASGILDIVHEGDCPSSFTASLLCLFGCLDETWFYFPPSVTAANR